MRLLLTGGGTGGHIFPALTLLRYIEQHEEHLEVLYVGSTNGLEQSIVGRTDIPFRSIPAAGLKRELSISGLKTVMTTWRGYRQAKRIMREFKPDVVVGTGGYVTLPVIYAADRYGIPCVVWEGNALPGLTNQLCASKSYAVAVVFPETEQALKRARKVVVTGNPRASEVLDVRPEDQVRGLEEYGLSPDRRLVMSFMGSRGAETVNEVLISMVPKFNERKDWQFLFITGDKHYESVLERCAKRPENVKIVPFVHNMPNLLPRTDALIARAGSSTLAEICALGIASILIPSPYVTANHQEHNARRLVEQGAAHMMKENTLTMDALWSELETTLDTPSGEHMRQAARQMGTPNAVVDLYHLVKEAMVSTPSSRHRP